ncbi:MAG TPA: PIN domain nuclease, partial [Thermoanaerobaculia bacterium]|nr:PIN domain nuclease [Thermoanaerobaculia bacterium]
MRVLVDTSAWADYLNGHPTAEREALRELIAGDDDLFTCGVVVAEVFQGLRKEKGREELADLFRQLGFLEPDGIDAYFRAATLYRDLRARGVTVRSTIDCLIAVLAE